jgi:hypothetical protein
MGEKGKICPGLENETIISRWTPEKDSRWTESSLWDSLIS